MRRLQNGLSGFYLMKRRAIFARARNRAGSIPSGFALAAVDGLLNKHVDGARGKDLIGGALQPAHQEVEVHRLSQQPQGRYITLGHADKGCVHARQLDVDTI